MVFNATFNNISAILVEETDYDWTFKDELKGT
jgi:hypothetical protein